MDWQDSTGKVLIAGTGRCGTTFLVQLLTLLGLPTGIEYRDGQWLMSHYQKPILSGKGMAIKVKRVPPPGWKPGSGYMPDVRAGLEYHVSLSDDQNSLRPLPKIIKNPRFATMLDQMLAEGRIQVDHVLACVRDLQSVAKSKYESGQQHPRERYYHKTAKELRKDSAEQLGEFTAALVTYEVSHTFISFPQMVDDPYYLWKKLSGLLLPTVMEGQFVDAHQTLSNEKFVNHRRPF